MKENETLADIVKEMREWSEDENDALSRYADRIEAAAERERTAHVNDIHDALYNANEEIRRIDREEGGAR